MKTNDDIIISFRLKRLGIIPDNQRLIYLRDLFRELVARDMKVRYRHSILGVAWSLLNPLLQLLVYYFIFRVVLSVDAPRYLSYLYTGLLVYIWFQSSLLQAANVITGNVELVRRPGFPVPLLPIITITTNLIHFLLALPILIPFGILEGSDIGVTILFLPVIIFLQFLLILGLAYLVASVNVVFRDVEYLLAIFLRLFFFLTPIFYQPSRIPARFQTLYHLNPLVSLVNSYRAMLIEGTSPDWLALLWPFLLGVSSLYLGYRVFKLMRYRFVEEL